ncbi:MAG: T9SS type A sorting domain-containing protein [Bacteroidota bacterium]|nr:T9SS type A sorting domain-containing protein [Bacteroidota bacterium]MDP4230335.1 T9SS type A sorting domain-containing protein [Bacteroidota bacterium]
MLVRVIVFLLLASTTAFAQVDGVDALFTNALQEELSKHENGLHLYQRSEVFRKMILRHVAEKLRAKKPEYNNIPFAQHQSQRGVFSGDLSNDSFGQEETSVAISRKDPNRIIVGSNDEAANIRSLPVFLTTNGGTSWYTSRMPIPPAPYYAYCDPFLAADQYGGFYYAFLIFNEKLSMSNIMVAHSADGAVWTYGEPVIFGKGSSASMEDKESIAVDFATTSATNGRVYVSWMHFDSDPSKEGLQLAWSDNLGQNWSAPVKIDDGSGFFSQVKVDNNGNVFYTMSEYRGDGALAGQYMLISYDHGATFVRRKIADYFNFPISTKFQVPTLKGYNGIQAFPYIAMEYDSHLSTLHAVYGTYQKWNDSVSSALLYYVKTTDEGKSWSYPYPIGFQGDSAALKTDRFMPWIGVDEGNGDVHIIYYSSEDDPNNLKVEAYRAIIHSEGGVSYSRLSDSLFNPLHVTDYNTNPFIGDYIGCQISGSTYVYTWTEDRKGYSDGEIYAYVTNPNAGVSAIHQVSANALRILSTYPNPVRDGKIKLGFAIPTEGNVSISLTSLNGSSVTFLFADHLAQGTYEKEIDLGLVSSGEYIISLDVGNQSTQKQIVVIH